MDLTLGLFQIGVLGALAIITGLLWSSTNHKQHINIYVKCKEGHNVDCYAEDEQSGGEWEQDDPDIDAEEVNEPDEQE